MNKLTRKILLFVGGLLVLFSCASILAFSQMRNSVDNYSNVLDQEVVNDQEIRSALIEFKTQIQEWKNTLLRGSNQERREKYWAAFKKRENGVQVSMDRLLVNLAEGESRDLVKQFRDAHLQMGVGYLQGFDAFVKSGYKSAPGDAAVSGMDREPSKLLVQASEVISRHVEQSQADAQTSYDHAVKFSLLLACAIVVIGLVGAAWLARSVVRQIGGDPQEATEAVNRMAAGDMASKVVLKKGDTSSLMAAMENMRVELTSIVEHVRQSSTAIASESTQIAAGSADQNRRIQQLGDSLGETASSMQELSSTVVNNAATAEQADELAEQASTIAGEGGRVVAEVVETMREIHASSSKISDIITVIDGIAFQTNLLALNAAVEAARAGPEGRGFAVVAGEVRALAHRSADAANDIKMLITESVNRVDQGGRLVDKAGTTMGQVVDSIEQVKSLIGDINTASVEQSLSVQKIDSAVTAMEGSTQQSAIVVKENAGAADRLRSQSMQLDSGVEMFKLSTDEELDVAAS